MTRAEHLAWCKSRAHEYLAKGDCVNAVASMLSDLNKHDETRISNPLLSMLGMQVAAASDTQETKRFIDGFN